MFDVGWPELLVIAIVLIVVVGPKDLPPMLRAFGRTTAKLRKMANEFRGQFDEALRESEFEDVRKTFSEARDLNPMNKIRDAVNPLKSTGDEIRSGLEKSVKTDAPSDKAGADKAEPAPVTVPEPTLKLDDGPPATATPAVADKPAATKKSAASDTSAKAPANASTKTPARRKTAATKTAAKTASAKTVGAKAAPAKSARAKAQPAAKVGTDKPATDKTAAKPAKASRAKPAKSGKDHA